MASMELPYKLVDEDKVPTVTKTRSQEWLKLFKSIPKGKAIVTNEKDLGVKVAHLYNVLRQLIKDGELTPNYKVSQRKKGDVVYVYIINSAKMEEKS